MTLRTALFCLIILCLLAACEARTDVARSPSPQATLPPLTPTQTVIPARTPTVTVTIRPTKTSTPIPTNSSPAPLSETGPWMMFYSTNSSTGPNPIRGPILMNADGSAWEPVNLPGVSKSDQDNNLQWMGSASWSRPFIALQAFKEFDISDCGQSAPTTLDPEADMLYILKLPENKVVQTVRLLGLEALAEVQKYNCTMRKQNSEFSAPVLGVTENVTSLRWSPDGRYLVFPAAPDSPAADLYIFDTFTESVRRLTTRQNNPRILSWSWDGQYVLYEGVKKFEYFNTRTLESKGVYAVTIAGTDRFLFKPDFVPRVEGWLSMTTGIVNDGFCDPTIKCGSHLRIVDLATGTNEVIYNNPEVRINIYADPFSHHILVKDPPVESSARKETTPSPGASTLESTERRLGLFRLDLGMRTMQPIIEGEVPYPIWDEELDAFLLVEYEKNPQHTKHVSQLYYDRDQGYRIIKLDNRPYLSPDWRWMIKPAGQEWFMRDMYDRRIQKVSGPDGNWSPDSSAYVEIVYQDQLKEWWLMVYRQRNYWRPVLARRISTGAVWGWVWIQP
jgi:hypothetical protein